jgi:hypothetical protein
LRLEKAGFLVVLWLLPSPQLMKHHLPVLLLPLFLLASCQSQEGGVPAAGGLATAGALAVAVPLAPLAGVYHVLSGGVAGEQARDAARGEQEKPVWQQRSRELQARNPQRDAKAAFAQGSVAFITYRLESTAIEVGKMQGSVEDVASNARVIRSSPLLSQIMDLVSPYSLVKNGDWIMTEDFRKYEAISKTYKAAFNTEMYRLVKNRRSNDPLLPPLHPTQGG